MFIYQLAYLRFETNDYNTVVNSEKNKIIYTQGAEFCQKGRQKMKGYQVKEYRILVEDFYYYLFESRFILM